MSSSEPSPFPQIIITGKTLSFALMVSEDPKDLENAVGSRLEIALKQLPIVEKDIMYLQAFSLR